MRERRSPKSTPSGPRRTRRVARRRENRAEQLPAHYKIAPLQDHLGSGRSTKGAVCSGRAGGLVDSWTADSSSASPCINAKAEKIETRPSFEDAFAKRRCCFPPMVTINGAEQTTIWRRSGSITQTVGRSGSLDLMNPGRRHPAAGSEPSHHYYQKNVSDLPVLQAQIVIVELTCFGGRVVEAGTEASIGPSPSSR